MRAWKGARIEVKRRGNMLKKHEGRPWAASRTCPKMPEAADRRPPSIVQSERPYLVFLPAFLAVFLAFFADFLAFFAAFFFAAIVGSLAWLRS